MITNVQMQIQHEEKTRDRDEEIKRITCTNAKSVPTVQQKWLQNCKYTLCSKSDCKTANTRTYCIYFSPNSTILYVWTSTSTFNIFTYARSNLQKTIFFQARHLPTLENGGWVKLRYCTILFYLHTQAYYFKICWSYFEIEY